MNGWHSYDGWKGARPECDDGPSSRPNDDVVASRIDKEALGGMEAKDFGSPGWCVAHDVAPVTTAHRGVAVTRYVRRCPEPSCGGTVEDHGAVCPRAAWNQGG